MSTSLWKSQQDSSKNIHCPKGRLQSSGPANTAQSDTASKVKNKKIH